MKAEYLQLVDDKIQQFSMYLGDKPWFAGDEVTYPHCPYTLELRTSFWLPLCLYHHSSLTFTTTPPSPLPPFLPHLYHHSSLTFTTTPPSPLPPLLPHLYHHSSLIFSTTPPSPLPPLLPHLYHHSSLTFTTTPPSPLPPLLPHLYHHSSLTFTTTPPSPFITSPSYQITFPDFSLYELFDQHRLFEPSILDKYPNLKVCCRMYTLSQLCVCYMCYVCTTIPHVHVSFPLYMWAGPELLGSF